MTTITEPVADAPEKANDPPAPTLHRAYEQLVEAETTLLGALARDRENRWGPVMGHLGHLSALIGHTHAIAQANEPTPKTAPTGR
jgi:hypothetical protein